MRGAIDFSAALFDAAPILMFSAILFDFRHMMLIAVRALCVVLLRAAAADAPWR